METFRKHVLDKVLALVSDTVPNVRIQVAKCLKDTILPHGKQKKTLSFFFETNFNLLFHLAGSFGATCPDADAIERTLAKLRADPDRDVRGHTDGYLTPEDESIAAGAPEITATGSTIDTASTSSTSSTSSLSPPPPPHPLAGVSGGAGQQQQQQGGGEHDQEQEEDVKLDFPSDNWLFDAIHQQQEFEF